MLNKSDLVLRDHEKIEETVYHHLVVILPHLFVSVLILVLDFFLMYYLFMQGWWGVVLFSAVIVAVVFYILRLAFLYKKNRFILTNERIIDCEQAGFFEKFVNEIYLNKVVEAKAMVKGLGASIFRYGNLKLVLDGELGPIEFYKISDPVSLQNKINALAQNQTAEPIKKDQATCARPIELIMGEVGALNRTEKEEIIRRIEDLLRDNE
jgi:hypothetical protein